MEKHEGLATRIVKSWNNGKLIGEIAKDENVERDIVRKVIRWYLLSN